MQIAAKKIATFILTSSCAIYVHIIISLDNHKQTNVLILDFSKAFDTVPYQRVLLKLKQCGMQGKARRWISSWLSNRTERVVFDGDASHKIQIFPRVLCLHRSCF